MARNTRGPRQYESEEDIPETVKADRQSRTRLRELKAEAIEAERADMEKIANLMADVERECAGLEPSEIARRKVMAVVNAVDPMNLYLGMVNKLRDGDPKMANVYLGLLGMIHKSDDKDASAKPLAPVFNLNIMSADGTKIPALSPTTIEVE